MADFNSTPGANLGTRFALTSMARPLRGFFTRRALRCETPNVPNPEMVTRSPRTRLARMPDRNASNARVACARVIEASDAIFPTSSFFVTGSPFNARDLYQRRGPVSTVLSGRWSTSLSEPCR